MKPPVSKLAVPSLIVGAAVALLSVASNVHGQEPTFGAGAPASTAKASATSAPSGSSSPGDTGSRKMEDSGGSLKEGEYACYGSGGRIMAGLGFKVLPGGRYTDLDGKNAGTYTISGTDVIFKGGHMEEIKGRELKGHKFRVGAQAVCEPY